MFFTNACDDLLDRFAFSQNSHIDAGQNDATQSDSIKIDAAPLDPNAWAIAAGGEGGDTGLAIAVDSSGNAYVTGSFSQQAIFGTTTLSAKGAGDIFICKISSSGKILWAYGAGGTNDAFGDNGLGIAIDNSGDAYVTGQFSSIVIFGSNTIYSTGVPTVFVAKFSSDGQPLWSTSAGGTSYCSAKSISIDAEKNSFITGHVSDTNNIFGNITLSAKGAHDVFVAKINSNGEHVWAISGGSPFMEEGNDIALDSAKNIYVTGYFEGSVSFGTISTPSSKGKTDIFVAKFDSLGTPFWAKGIGSLGTDEGSSIAVDILGNVYVAGGFGGAINFGSDILYADTSSDVFVARFDTNGSSVWAKSIAGNGSIIANDIALDLTGNSYVAGSFTTQAVFGTTTLTATNLKDAYVARIASDGNINWVTSAGGQGFVEAKSIAIDPNDNIYTTGYFYKTSVFANTTLSAHTIDKPDLFVWKMPKP